MTSMLPNVTKYYQILQRNYYPELPNSIANFHDILHQQDNLIVRDNDQGTLKKSCAEVEYYASLNNYQSL